MPFLHGRLDFYIDRAEDLPDPDFGLFNIDKNYTDAFVTAEIGPVWLFKTRYINDNLNPVWEESFSIPICQENAENMIINVKDKDLVGSTSIASLTFPCVDMEAGEEIEGWFDLVADGESQGRIKLSVKFLPKEEEDRLKKEVAYAYFPLREGNRLTLYQDADTPQLPQVCLALLS